MSEPRVPAPTDEVEQFGGRRTSRDLWHVKREDIRFDDVSWCGAGRQFAHLQRFALVRDATCPRCQRRLRLGRPLAKGATS